MIGRTSLQCQPDAMNGHDRGLFGCHYPYVERHRALLGAAVKFRAHGMEVVDMLNVQDFLHPGVRYRA